MELYAGLDLHSRNTYIGIMDKELNRVFKKRVPNHLEHILQTLDSFRDQIKGFVVESTYNWYWLVDGLMDAGYSSAHLDIINFLKQKIRELEKAIRKKVKLKKAFHYLKTVPGIGDILAIFEYLEKLLNPLNRFLAFRLFVVLEKT